MKCDGVLTALCIVEDVINLSVCTVGLSVAVPGKALTCGYQCIGVYAVVDGQLQCYGVLTSLCIVEDVINLSVCTVGLSVAVPGKALTCCYQCIGVYAVVDGQLQCYGVLTALCIVEDVINLSVCTVGLSVAVPGKALTCCYQCIGVYAVVDGQLQCYGVLTALCIVEDVINLSVCTVGLSVAVPGKALTGCYQCIGVYAVVDGKLQCDCVLTALCIVEDVINLSVCTVGLSVAVPGKALTGCYQCIGVYAVVDGKLQCDCVLTALCIVEDVINLSVCTVGLSVAVPGKALTGCYQCIGVYAVVDGKLQCDCVLTALCIVEDVINLSVCTVGLSVAVPGKALTGCYQCIGVYAVVDGKLQCDCVLTALCIVEDVINLSVCTVGLSVAVPGKALTGCYQCIGVYAVVDGKLQCDCVLTALCIVEDVINLSVCTVGLSVAVPGKALTGCYQCIGVYAVVDGKLQCDCVLTALCIVEDVINLSVCTVGLSVAVPGKALTGCYQCIGVYAVVDGKLQCDCVLTALCIVEDVINLSVCTVGLSVAVPGKALTGCYQCIGVYAVVDGKLQCDCVLTALCIVEDVINLSVCTVGLSVAVPGKALTGCYQCIGVYAVVDGKLQCDCVLTALCIVEDVINLSVCTVGLSVAVPGKALTGCYQCIGVYAVVDGKLQCDCVLTALCIVEDVINLSVCTVGLSVAVPGKALTGCYQCIGVYAVVDGKLQCDCVLTALCIVEDVINLSVCTVGLSVAVPGKALTGCYQCIGVYAVVDGKLQCD